MEMSQDHFQWSAFVSAVTNFRVLLPGSQCVEWVCEWVYGLVTSSSSFLQMELKTRKQCARYIVKKERKSWWGTPAGRDTSWRLGKSSTGTVTQGAFALGEVGFVAGPGETCKKQKGIENNRVQSCHI
jgi:hypothetical protein